MLDEIGREREIENKMARIAHLVLSLVVCEFYFMYSLRISFRVLTSTNLMNFIWLRNYFIRIVIQCPYEQEFMRIHVNLCEKEFIRIHANVRNVRFQLDCTV